MCKKNNTLTPLVEGGEEMDDGIDTDSSSSDSTSLSTDSDSEDDVETPAVENAAGPSGNIAEETQGEDEEEEDEVVKAIRKERLNIRELPRDIICEDYVVQISFHPQEHIIALASITGDVLLHKYVDDCNSELLHTLELHTRACRDIEFSHDGTLLFSASKDKTMMVTDVQTGKLRQAYDEAHEDPLYCMRVIGDNQVATGDDTGTVKLWDLRQQREIFSLKEVNDFVSAMITTDAQRHLACTTGEGAITVLNLAARKLHVQSEMYETDLNCLALCRNDSKLAVGTSDGKLLLFNWGEFGYHNDEFPGPKHGINRLVAATDHVVVSACDDGNIRATYLFPHRHLGVIGQHAYPVESLDISSDGRLMASCSHDQTVKFWNIRYLENVAVNAKEKADKTKRTHNLPSSKVRNPGDFFQGLGDGD